MAFLAGINWGSLASSALNVVLGLFGYSKTTSADPTVAERKAGEDLGKAETENANADAGIEQMQGAVAAGDRADAAIAADPSKLTDASKSDGALAPYRPGTYD